MLKTLPIMTLLAFTIAGCAANYQTMPVTVGKNKYSISGYTDFGQKDPSYAKNYADKFAKWYCKSEYVVNNVETRDATNLAGFKFLQWTAEFSCLNPDHLTTYAK